MLHFDIDWQDLLRIGEELQASDKQIKFALSRALRRTEASLRKLSSKGLPKVLEGFVTHPLVSWQNSIRFYSLCDLCPFAPFR